MAPLLIRHCKYLVGVTSRIDNVEQRLEEKADLSVEFLLVT